MNLEQQVSPHTGQRIYVDSDGKVYPSVSRVSKAFFSTYHLYRWRQRVGPEEADRVSKESADRGTEIHRCLETNTESEQFQSYIDSYRRLLAPHLVVEKAEPTLGYVSPNNERLGGKADVVGLWKDVPAIVDVKTSEEPKNPRFFGAFSLQCASYAVSDEQEYGSSINQGVILNLLPNDSLAFEIDLTYPKEFLLEIALPSFYKYYRLPANQRGYANKFISKEISQFEKRIIDYVKVA